MGVIVAFDYAKWAARYPEFSAVNQATAEEYFAEATMYHANDGGGPVCNSILQLTLLNMLTAHIAARYSAPGGGAQAANSLVGRISNATEGSVSVGTQNEYGPGTVQWFQQTKYGSDYWNATKQFRTMRYRPRPGTSANYPGWLYPNR